MDNSVDFWARLLADVMLTAMIAVMVFLINSIIPVQCNYELTKTIILDEYENKTQFGQHYISYITKENGKQILHTLSVSKSEVIFSEDEPQRIEEWRCIGFTKWYEYIYAVPQNYNHYMVYLKKMEGEQE